jgi:hypothetical protein
MKRLTYLLALCLSSSACTTLNDSLKLGAASGALAGASATYAAQRGNGQTPSVEDAAIGASVGLGIGLIVSYFVHESVSEERAAYARETEIYFGDLPPSPFIVPTNASKKGTRR